MTEYSGDDDKPKSPFTPGVVAILAIVLLALIGLNIILAALVVQARVGALVMLRSAAQAAPQRGTTDSPQETFPHPPGQMSPEPVPGVAGGPENRSRPASPAQVAPAQPVSQARPQPKSSFSSLDDALEAFQANRFPSERGAAMNYIVASAVDAERRQAVVEMLLGLLNDPATPEAAVSALGKWANADSAPAIRAHLATMIATDAGALNASAARRAMTLAKLLVSLKDEQGVAMMLKMTHARTVQDEAVDAIIALGTPAEEALRGILIDATDAGTREDVLALLAKMGTEKSIPAMQTAMTDKNPEVVKAAGEALTKLASRLGLKADQYLYNLFDKYTIGPPVGFRADPTMTLPNCKRWTRQAPGRMVRSSYTVNVQMVGKDYKLNAIENGPAIQAGEMTFRALPAPAAPPFTQAVHFAAVDGEYLIDLVAILDTADGASAANMDNAVNKIRAKGR